MALSPMSRMDLQPPRLHKASLCDILFKPWIMADDGDSNRAQKPLLGVILCCTSIPPEKRVELADVAIQMGAIHKFDLTSDVTHLIVGDTDTPKYKFVARERTDVKCLLPTWIEAVRDSWIAGGETDVERLEAEHMLQTFHGLRICVTGFEDSYRKELEGRITSNGGEYKGNLTKDITHLIAKAPSGTKYTYGGDWGIKIVSIEWLEQSLERGMILDEKLYSLMLPPAERGQNAWIRRTASSASLGKRTRAEESGPKRSRKLRRTASAKLSSQNIGLWTDIVSGPPEVEDTKPSEWDDKQNDSVPKTKAETSNRPGPRNEIRKESPASEVFDEKTSRTSSSFSPAGIGRKVGLFRGHRFFMHGFSEKQSSILQGHLRSHLGEIVATVAELFTPSTTNQESRYLLVHHSTTYNDIPKLPQGNMGPIIVTDMWVERCLHRHDLVQPEANVTNTPFRYFPIAGFEKLSVSSTAFQGVDLLHMSKAVKLMGASYEEYFTSNASVLVCNAKVPSAQKSYHAQRWNVPIVTADWIWDCINTGQFQPFGKYLIQTSSHDIPVNGPSPLVADDTRGSTSGRKPLSRSSKTRDIIQSSEQNLERTEDDRPVLPINDLTRDTGLKSPNEKIQFPRIQSDRRIPSDAWLPAGKNPLNDDKTSKLEESSREISYVNNLSSTTLREISANSSPKPLLSPVKSPTRSPTKSVSVYQEEDSLGPAISDLLAHHQRSSAGGVARTISEARAPGRRRKQLFGRAPSSGSLGFSRASSIDTLNTDGLGTPLESSTAKNEPNPLAALRSYEEPESSHNKSEQHLQLTQLGYEDPDVQEWRNRIVKKMGGMTGSETGNSEGAGKRIKSIGVVIDVLKGGTEGVAKRTRQAMGRR